MTLFFILLSAGFCYALLLLFKQQTLMRERIENLETEKREMEQLLLAFMENVNRIDDDRDETRTEGNTDPVNHVAVRDTASEKEDAPGGVDVKARLEQGEDLDALARSLNRGAGEVALIAKLSKETTVAPR